MSTLERAVAIATLAHAGQVDLAGAPYIQHPLRVMQRMHTMEEKIVAVLHDVLEDTDITAERLAEEGFSSAVIEDGASVGKACRIIRKQSEIRLAGFLLDAPWGKMCSRHLSIIQRRRYCC